MIITLTAIIYLLINKYKDINIEITAIDDDNLQIYSRTGETGYINYDKKNNLILDSSDNWACTIAFANIKLIKEETKNPQEHNPAAIHRDWDVDSFYD